ncbi:MAG: hypothetical protein HXY37_14080 [Chloroflexi bacterium]|nr:hypothetical protein [Chloroflexota bacterium]
MQRQFASFTLMLCGAIMLAFGLALAPAPVPVAAGPLLQPSPRPPLEPTGDAGSGDSAPTPVPYGRVTGTIIDLRTGAPAPGKEVLIGDTVVVSDANGNYDQWVVSGFYTLQLRLEASEGQVATPPQAIAVGSGDTVLVHLFFTSAPAAPTATAALPTPTATVAVPVVATSVAAPTATPAPLPDDALAVAPESLPNTAASVAGVPGPLLLVGALLLGLGALLQVRPRHRAGQAAAADGRMLRRMLATPPKPGAEETLRDLLEREP